jgi:uncharacterized protein YciI
MTAELPDGVAIQQVWVVEASYGPDVADRRPPVRAEHLARIAVLREAGTIIEAGAFSDMSGSLILVRAASEEAALAVARDDVYYRSGVWTELRARAFGRVVGVDELAAD